MLHTICTASPESVNSYMREDVITVSLGCVTVEASTSGQALLTYFISIQTPCRNAYATDSQLQDINPYCKYTLSLLELYL